YELLQSVETCIEKATEQFRSKGFDPSAVRAVGLTNQRETLVLWDRTTGEPLYNAVVWPDTRTAHLVRELKAPDGGYRLQDLGGPTLSTSPSSVKLLWLLRNVDAVKEAYDDGRLAFGTIDTWLIYKLNKRHVYVTDATNASRTMFMNLRTCEYDDELLSF